jgi:signal peptidase I
VVRRVQGWFDQQNFIIQTVLLLLFIFLIRTLGFGLYQVPTGSMETTMLVGDRFFADKFTIWFSSIKHEDVISFNDPNFTYSDNYMMNMWERYVWGPSNWTKRVIGIPGDNVVGKIENDTPVVYRNGEKLDEPYLNQYPLIALWCPDDTSHGPSRVPICYRSYDPSVPFDEQPFYRMNPADIVRHPNIERLREPRVASSNDEFDVVLGDDEYWLMGDNRRNSYDSREWGALKENLIHGKIQLLIFSVDPRSSWLVLDLLQHPIDFWTRVRWSRCMQLVR